jgi:hypothetical protein
MPDLINLEKLPKQDAPNYFRKLVRNCIKTYGELPNDAMCLDYNRVSGKLRALVLDDEEYKRETRNIYARQQLEELRGLEELTKLSSEEKPDEDEYDPHGMAKRKKKSAADKDMITMRFKAAQMRRELIAALNDNNNASERDAVNLLFVGMLREEIEKSAKDDIHEGGSDDALEDLTSPKEEAPEGTSGKVRGTSRTEALGDEDFFDVLPNGEVVEK